MKNFTSMLSGVVLGALVASGLVLLFTPLSGKELRERAIDYAQNVRDEVRQAGVEKRAELEAQLASLRSGESEVA